MRFLKPLVAAGFATAMVATATSAQSGNTYNAHWAPMHNNLGGIAVSGPFLFAHPNGGVNYASFGDAMRRCYGIDTTSGGRNQSTGGFGPPSLIPGQATALPGTFEMTYMRWLQGYAAANAASEQSADAGFVTVIAGTESDLGGDVCFSPFAQSAGNLGGSKTSMVGFVGDFGGAAPPFPAVASSATQWLSTTSPAFEGIPGPTTNGVDGVLGNPLIANVIYEVQGPLNGGPGNNQYYIASTNESTGRGSGAAGFGGGTGGVTNGNADWGSSIFAVDAATSGAISHTRVIANDPAGTGALALAPEVFIPGTLAGSNELAGMIAFNTPSLWGRNNGSEGAGGNDWTASTVPVSTVNLRAVDHWYGAKGNPAANAFDPCAGFLGFNLPIFLWSATPAVTMPQLPMAWDDLAVPGPFAQPGSFLFGNLLTSDEGFQTVPANFDTVTTTILTITGLTLGVTFAPSDDAFVDGTTASLFEGMFNPQVSGVSTFSGGDQPIVGNANPNFQGVRFGIGWVGVNLEPAGCPFALIPQLTNFGNAVTIVLQ